MLHVKLRNRTCQGLDRQGQGLDLQGQGLTSLLFTGRMPFLSLNQQCQSTEGNDLFWRQVADIELKCYGWQVQRQSSCHNEQILVQVLLASHALCHVICGQSEKYAEILCHTGNRNNPLPITSIDLSLQTANILSLRT